MPRRNMPTPGYKASKKRKKRLKKWYKPERPDTSKEDFPFTLTLVRRAC